MRKPKRTNYLQGGLIPLSETHENAGYELHVLDIKASGISLGIDQLASSSTLMGSLPAAAVALAPYSEGQVKATHRRGEKLTRISVVETSSRISLSLLRTGS